jgi:hypothetical protein
MGTITGWLFMGATTALFLWGFWMAYKGIRADHQPWLSFGHAPGGRGSFDSRLPGHQGSSAA